VYGTEEQKNTWLPGVFSGETSFCLGATEPTGGSDLANLRTTAKMTPDGKFYIVNGHKVSARNSPRGCQELTLA
jgi:alkylation response protein AidB-like acyl-CoA dehydrogenase